MAYFKEVEDYRTYLGKDDDFHFIYNANTGGGQSFLGGKFRTDTGELSAPASLNGRLGVFCFGCGGLSNTRRILLADDAVCYEVKPRAEGDSNMKLCVGNKPTPNEAIAAFLMLPKPCGVKRTSNTDASVLSSDNFWLHSMWMSVDATYIGKAIFTPHDCVVCGGVDKKGNGAARYFAIDFKRRISDIVQLSGNCKLDEEILSCIRLFSDVYKGKSPFVYEDSVRAIKSVMKYLSGKYPEQYSGTLDPLHFILSLSEKQNTPSQVEDVNGNLLPLALRLFAERRVGEWREAGREVNAKVRDYFAALTAEKLAAKEFGDDQIAELFCGVKDADGKVVFSPMWSGTPGSGWGNIKPSSAAETKAVRDFLMRLRSGVGVAAEFRQDGFDHPKGFGPAVVSELLMKFHPETCFKHGQTTFEVLTELGLVKFDHPFKNDFSDADYKQVCGVAAKLIATMCEMKLPRSISADGTGDGEVPDYLTVNEFVWFVNENKELIKEESMKMKLETPDTSRKHPGKRTWADVLSDKPDELMNRLVAALLTKPFAILAGASGTGKSRMVRKLAYMTCLNAQLQPDRKTKKPIENFCMVAVKPNWHDSTDLLGYRSAVSSAHRYVSTDFVRFVLKAHAFPDTPFFVCLDEMNLAPVEHYFAEFLSASETMREEADGEFVTDPIVGPGEFDGDLANLDPSGYAVPSERKALIERIGLYLPKNLFVVGTVNMDDSTSAFSRKVVDRAMTLVMDDVNYADLQKTSKFDLFDQVGKDGKLEAEGVLLAEEQIAAFVKRRGFRPESLQSPLVERLTALKEILHQTPLAIGYRFARECVQYRDAVRMLMAEKDGVDYDGFALDHLILMKVLPRLVGNRDDHADLLNQLRDFFKGLNEQKLGDHEHALSASALKRMEQAAEHNGGYLSFYP